MKTIAFFNVKGGVGKTTSSITVAHNLATAFNKRVLIIDLDPQSNTTDFFNCYDKQFTVANVLSGKGYDENGKETLIKIKDAICKTDFKNLDILPARLDLGRVEKQLVADVSSPQQFRLRKALSDITDDYDFVIIDCSPSAESLVNTNGLAVADAVFVPLKCDKWATRGLNATLEVVDTISEYNTNLVFGGAFFVQWENRNVNKVVYENLKEELDTKMFDIKIRKNKSVEEMTYTNTPLMLYDKKGTATTDYLELTKKIVEIVR